MNRGAAWALSALLGLLLMLSVFGEVWILPRGVERTTATFPEVAPLAPLAVAWGVAAISCCQAMLIIGLRLVALAGGEGKYYSSAYRWHRAIVGCLLLLVALVIAAIAILSGLGYLTPLMFWPTIIGIIALLTAVVLSTSRVVRRPRGAGTGRSTAAEHLSGAREISSP